MATVVFRQNFYICDVTNKYTQHIKKFSLNTDVATVNGAKNRVK